MALPSSVETPRLRYLHGLVDAATQGGWMDWPEPRETDYANVGKIVVLYSYIDVNIRRIVEAADNAGILAKPWAGRVSKLRIGEAEEAVKSLPEWSEPNMTALNQISDRRGLRNLVAHLAFKRFPTEDAFVFFTKSEFDYVRAFGNPAPAGTVMTAVMEANQLPEGIKHIRALQRWLANATSQAEKILISHKPRRS